MIRFLFTLMGIGGLALASYAQVRPGPIRPAVTPDVPVVGGAVKAPAGVPGLYRGSIISTPPPEQPKPHKDPGVIALPGALNDVNPDRQRAAALKIIPPPEPHQPELIGQISIQIGENGRVKATLNYLIWCVAYLEMDLDSKNEFSGVFAVPEWAALQTEPLKLEGKVEKTADGGFLISGKVVFAQITFFGKFEATRVADPGSVPTGYFGVPQRSISPGPFEITFTVRANRSPDGTIDPTYPAAIAADVHAAATNEFYHAEGRVDATGYFVLGIIDRERQMIAALHGDLFPGPAWKSGGADWESAGPGIIWRLLNVGILKPGHNAYLGYAVPAKAPPTKVKRPIVRPPASMESA